MLLSQADYNQIGIYVNMRNMTVGFFRLVLNRFNLMANA